MKDYCPVCRTEIDEVDWVQLNVSAYCIRRGRNNDHYNRLATIPPSFFRPTEAKTDLEE